MKITTAQYAKALEASVENKSNEEIVGMVSNFLKVLKRNNQLKLAGKIMEKFSALYDFKNDIVEATVMSARELDEKSLKEVEEFVAKKYEAKKVILKTQVKKEIKGGMILRVGDEMFDASISKKINDLKSILIR